VVVGSYKFVVFLIIFCSRGLLVFLIDPKAKRRSLLRNIVWCLCYCLITGVWDKDERSPVASRRAYLFLNILDTVESTIFICYAAFLSKACIFFPPPLPIGLISSIELTNAVHSRAPDVRCCNHLSSSFLDLNFILAASCSLHGTSN
jgi:hypothetical protein